MAGPINPFEDLLPGTGAGPAAAAPAMQTRRLRLKPKDEPAAQTPAQAEADKLGVEKLRLELEEKRAEAARTKKDAGEAIRVLMTELGTAADAHRLTRTNPNSVGWGNFAFGHDSRQYHDRAIPMRLHG